MIERRKERKRGERTVKSRYPGIQGIQVSKVSRYPRYPGGLKNDGKRMGGIIIYGWRNINMKWEIVAPSQHGGCIAYPLLSI